MNCERARELMSQYIDGLLAGDLEEALTEHLSRCERCRGELESLQKAVGLVKDLETVEPPEDLLDGIHARIEEEKHAGKGWILAFPQVRVALAAGLVVAIGILALRSRPPVPPPGRTMEGTTRVAERSAHRADEAVPVPPAAEVERLREAPVEVRAKESVLPTPAPAVAAKKAYRRAPAPAGVPGPAETKGRIWYGKEREGGEAVALREEKAKEIPPLAELQDAGVKRDKAPAPPRKTGKAEADAGEKPRYALEAAGAGGRARALEKKAEPVAPADEMVIADAKLDEGELGGAPARAEEKADRATASPPAPRRKLLAREAPGGPGKVAEADAAKRVASAVEKEKEEEVAAAERVPEKRRGTYAAKPAGAKDKRAEDLKRAPVGVVVTAADPELVARTVKDYVSSPVRKLEANATAKAKALHMTAPPGRYAEIRKRDGSVVVTAQVPVQRYSALLAKLKTLGEVKVSQAPAGDPAKKKAELISLRITILRRPGK